MLGRTLHAIEQKVASVIVTLVDRPDVAAALLQVGKWGHGASVLARHSHDALAHALALPSRRDIAQLAARVARVDVAVAEILAQLENRALKVDEFTQDPRDDR